MSQHTGLAHNISSTMGKDIKNINKVSMNEILTSVNYLISSDGYNVKYKHFQFQNKFNYYINLIIRKPRKSSYLYSQNLKRHF